MADKKKVPLKFKMYEKMHSARVKIKGYFTTKMEEKKLSDLIVSEDKANEEFIYDVLSPYLAIFKNEKRLFYDRKNCAKEKKK